MTNVLITGGAGYIGSHACKKLKKNGFTPISLDNLSEGYETFVKWGPFVKADLNDKIALDKTFKKYQPIAVMHFAANAIVSESMKDPQKYYTNNVSGTINLLNAMLENNVKNIIFSSTCATYGMPKYTPICEKHSNLPISPYGSSKHMIEQILKDYDKAYGLKYIILRYFNAAGADFDAEIGEDHKLETHLIPLVIDTALNIYDNLSIYGKDFDTKDGTAIRDYIHVEDLADAHLKALTYLLNNNQSDIFNLGSEKGYSVLEIIQNIEAILNIKIPITYKPKRLGDPPVLFADSSKAKNILNWQARYSDLETIIKTALKWHRQKIS